jgi:xylulokinase
MILAIDVGTSTCKAAWFNEQGMVERTYAVSLTSISTAQGAQVIDPKQWAQALQQVCAQMARSSSLRAIVVSGNGPTVTPVFSTPQHHGSLLYASAAYARLWLDRRAHEEARDIAKHTGFEIDASFVLPQILHIKKTERDVYQKSHSFLSSYEYIGYLLTGNARTVLHAEDALQWYWTENLLSQLDLDHDKFPEFCHPGDIIGTVSLLASQVLDIPKDVPVIAGGPDFLVSILGCGVVSPGMVCDRSGTSEGINLCAHHPLHDNRLMTYRHPVAPYYNVSGIISTTGKAVAWIQKILNLTELSFSQVYDLASRAPCGANNLIFLPYLNGERAPIWDPHARGVFSGLSLTTDRSDLIRAVVEGICYAVRDVIETMEESGALIQSLRVAGGPSRSDVLNQIKSDITGKPISVMKHSDAELVGSLILARHTLGDYPSLTEAAHDLAVVEKSFTPDDSVSHLYTDRFTQYRTTYRQLKGSWRSE